MGRDADPKIGQLAETIREALKHRDAQRQAGASPEELARNLEQTLRAAWPQERVWKYLCDKCSDHGLVMFECPETPCGRTHPHQPHEYGRPCQCAVGRRFLPKAERDQDVPSAGKTTKPTRWGR